MNYFITGTPRTGTAWLSNFLTWKDSFCYHEGMHGTDLIGYQRKLENTNAKYIGDANTQAVLMLPWLYKLYPDAKYIFVHRDINDVKESLINNGFGLYLMDEIERSLEWGMKNIPSLVMGYDELFDDVEDIWNYIGLPDFPHERHHQLREMRIDNAHRFMAMTTNNTTSMIADMQGAY